MWPAAAAAFTFEYMPCNSSPCIFISRNNCRLLNPLLAFFSRGHTSIFNPFLFGFFLFLFMVHWLKPDVPLCGLFYFYVLELTSFTLKFSSTQHITLISPLYHELTNESPLSICWKHTTELYSSLQLYVYGPHAHLPTQLHLAFMSWSWAALSLQNRHFPFDRWVRGETQILVWLFKAQAYRGVFQCSQFKKHMKNMGGQCTIPKTIFKDFEHAHIAQNLSQD